MIVRGFKSVLWVGAVGGAALSCYMVSLRVATERADLARVQRQIVDTKRDIRLLHTELDTRGRLTQLEDWNANVLALSAPSPNQYVKDAYTLAQLPTREATVGDRASAVRLASLATGQGAPPAKPEPTVRSEAPKPARPGATPLPPVVEAVAPAPREAVPIRRASFEIPVTPVASAPQKAKAKAHDDAADTVASAPRPAKRRRIAKADPVPPHATKAAKKAESTATADAAPSRARKGKRTATAEVAPAHAGKVKTAAKDGDDPARTGATRLARAHAKGAGGASRGHGRAKLARADAAPGSPSSGHRGGAQ